MDEIRDTPGQSSDIEHAGRLEDPDEINLYDYYLVIKKRWKLIALVFFAATVAAGVISLVMTEIYRAETTILPIQSGSSGRVASMLGQLSELPLVTTMLPATSADKLVNVLESRTVREAIIRNLDLLDRLFPDEEKSGLFGESEPPTIQDGIRALGEITNVRKDRKGDLIKIAVDCPDPELAARIANRYPVELQRFLSENALSLAKRARIFLGERYKEAKGQLASSEETLRDFQTKHRLVAMDEQTEAAVKAIAELKAQVMAKEVELGVFRKFVTDTNPNVIRIKDEIKSLKKQLTDMESKKGNPTPDVFPTFNEAPTIGLEYMRLKRNVLINEKLFELLTQQYEMAKIEEAREDVAFQVIDRAVPPEKRFKPKRRMIVILAGTVAVFMGVFLAFFLEYVENVKPKAAGGQSTRGPD
jgi:uncharacterized protein involved in exopolysaccharide biosynthesis